MGGGGGGLKSQFFFLLKRNGDIVLDLCKLVDLIGYWYTEKSETGRLTFRPLGFFSVQPLDAEEAKSAKKFV